MAEIRDLARIYLEQPEQPIGPHLAHRLQRVRARLDARIGELQNLRRRIGEFEMSQATALAGRAHDFRRDDPRSRAAGA